MQLNEDNKLRLLSGKKSPIKLDNIKIIPCNLQEISDIGYGEYQKRIINLIAEPKDFGVEDENITTYDIIIAGMTLGSNEQKDFVLESLGMFIKDNIIFNPNEGFIVTSNQEDYIGCINKSNYEDLKLVIKWQNFFESKKTEEEFNPANSKAEEIRNKILKGRNKSNKDNVELDDIISSICVTCDSINVLNVWDLTLYQIDNQTNRYKMFEDFNNKLKSIFAGAKPDSINLKYYVRPIEK